MATGCTYGDMTSMHCQLNQFPYMTLLIPTALPPFTCLLSHHLLLSFPLSSHQGILGDLFPGVTLPEHDYGVLQSAIENATLAKGLQVVPAQVLYIHVNICVHTCIYCMCVPYYAYIYIMHSSAAAVCSLETKFYVAIFSMENIFM